MRIFVAREGMRLVATMLGAQRSSEGSPMRRVLGSLMLATLAATSCGDGDRSPADIEPVVDAVPPTSTTVTTTVATTNDPEDVAATGIEATLLTRLLDEPVRADGLWPLSAGRWVTEAFAEPAAFDVPVDAGLVVEGRSMLWLRVDDIVDPHGLLFVDPAVVFDSGVPRPVADTPADLDEQLRSLDGVDIVDSGELVDVGSWWDLVLHPASPGFECDLGNRCEFVLRTAGDDLVWLPVEETVRLYLAAGGGDRVALVIGSAAARPELTSVAESILSSWSPTELDGDVRTRFLRSIGGGGRTVPDGAWATSLGAGTVRFEVVNNDAVRLAVALSETALFVADEGSLMLQTAVGLVPPTFEQGDALGALPDDETLDARGWTVDEFEAWLRALLVVSDSGTMSLGEVELSWWDVTVDDTVVSTPCGRQRTADGQGRCVDFATRDLGWFIADSQPARIYFGPEQQLIARLASTTIDADPTVVAGVMAPVIDRMTFEPGLPGTS